MRKGDDPRGQIQAKINNFWCFLKKKNVADPVHLTDAVPFRSVREGSLCYLRCSYSINGSYVFGQASEYAAPSTHARWSCRLEHHVCLVGTTSSARMQLNALIRV